VLDKHTISGHPIDHIDDGFSQIDYLSAHLGY
jgi:hypothetical protein